MIFSPEVPTGSPQYAISDSCNPSQPARITARDENAVKRVQTFQFAQQIFAMDDGQTLLRLHKPLKLIVDRQTAEFDVEGWGIHMQCADVAELPRRIARRFLSFLSKSDAGLLNSREKSEWLDILDQVDTTQFNIDRAAPRYVEGTLKRKSPTVVEWHDGANEQINPALAAVFFPLDPGDRFSAFVKLGKNNNTLKIERVSLIEV